MLNLSPLYNTIPLQPHIHAWVDLPFVPVFQNNVGNRWSKPLTRQKSCKYTGDHYLVLYVYGSGNIHHVQHCLVYSFSVTTHHHLATGHLEILAHSGLDVSSLDLQSTPLSIKSGSPLWQNLERFFLTQSDCGYFTPSVPDEHVMTSKSQWLQYPTPDSSASKHLFVVLPSQMTARESLKHDTNAKGTDHAIASPGFRLKGLTVVDSLNILFSESI